MITTDHLVTALAQAPAPQAQTRGDWDWDFASDILPELLSGLWVTIQLTLAAIVVALTLGLVLAILRRSRRRVISWPVGLVIEFIRSTPLLVQVYFLFYVLPQWGIVIDAFPTAVFALGIHYACYTSETYRAGIESVEKGQWEAATALNLSSLETWRTVVLPQAVPRVIPALGNYVVASFKDAPLASAIGLVGVLGAARAISGSTFRNLEAFTIAGLLFLAVSVPAAIGVRYLERRFRVEHT